MLEVDAFQVPLPLGLVGRNLTLGASAGYTFGDMATRKGLFNRRPFSFLSDTAVSGSIALLPTTALEFNFAKAVQPIRRANPFNVNISTTFSGSMVNPSPEVGLRVSKPIGDRQVVFCSWSSGSLPNVFYEPDISIRGGLSGFRLGFIVLPERSENTSPAGEDRDEDELYREARRRKQEAQKARELFQFQVAASPIGGSFTLNYSRNLFSGKPADELPLAEWSSEGYHDRPLMQSEPRSVKLEIATTIGLDLSLGWNVTGLRRVGEFTRMGLGVGVEGDKGLVMTFSWRRLGQRINIPIVMCPVETVTSNAAALAVIFPWVTYCAVEFGLLRPRERKRRRQAIVQRHKELKKLIPQKREKSRQTVELMTEHVRRQQAREEAHDGLVVTKAEYGNDEVVVDVTIPVAALVNHGQLVIPREIVKVRESLCNAFIHP